MIRIIASFELKPENVDHAIDLAKQLVEETRKEAGCAQYDLVQSAKNPAQLVILERWETQTALDTHSASAHFTRLVPMLAGLCQQPPAVDTYTEIL